MFGDFKLIMFDTLVRCGGFTKAARELGVSQPAVSQSLAELEKSLGAELVNRGRSGISLTEKGQLFHRYCKRILYWYDAAEEALRSEDGSAARIIPVRLEDGREVEVSAVDGGLNIKILP